MVSVKVTCNEPRVGHGKAEVRVRAKVRVRVRDRARDRVTVRG